MEKLTPFINLQTDSLTDNNVNEEVVAYSQSLQKLRDIQSGLEYARAEYYNDGLEKGRAEGRAEGKAEGRAEGVRESAKKMLKAGIEPSFIHEILGIPLDDILSLQ